MRDGLAVDEVLFHSPRAFSASPLEERPGESRIEVKGKLHIKAALVFGISKPLPRMRHSDDELAVLD